ncbi:MAG: hypothetical protein UR68_C0005G0037 [Candidatus Roizmanbacteria bacterium GW2011_GWA2_35_19]|uniref:Type I restriction modification DNA specificity domain-containing protein n=2 Tax=Candidatus Roizmaniibacteriota TaxID=1752723 RepID=A0A0G0BVJ1_9BACT|nr:MAG: hypothetical protein UR63_C0005G0021 [Candidatus Roizmanbacteria bacterium GW2011_GWC2_35_12]KKP73303.1 MAG: hypothetical protein UR68_C0005G0037 [Candidatus Roizmanbacteria bacterium GW2011_GWA2_35_19]
MQTLSVNNTNEKWPTVKLIELVDYKKGKKPADLIETPKSNYLPYIDIEAFEKGIINRYTSDKSAPVSNDNNDILVVWDGARAGLVGKATGVVGSTLMKLTPKDVNRDYLLLYLLSKYEDINKNPRGTGIPHVNPDIFWDLDVPTPSTEEQSKIVFRLKSLMQDIKQGKSKIAKAKANLTNFRQAILTSAITGKLTEDWRKGKNVEPSTILFEKIKNQRKIKSKAPKSKLDFNSLPPLPEKWIYVYFGDIVSDFKYGTSEKSDYSYEGTPVLRIPNVISQKINTSDLKYLSKKETRGEYLVKNGDILIVRSNGSRDLVGKNALISELDGDYAYASYLIRIRPVLVAPGYLSILLNSDLGRRQLFSNAKSAAGINNINTQELASIVVPLPSIDEQNEIITKVNEYFEVADKTGLQIDKAEKQITKLTQAVLAKTFQGN